MQEKTAISVIMDGLKDFWISNKKAFIRGIIVCFFLGFLLQLVLIQLYKNITTLLTFDDNDIIISELLGTYFGNFLIFFPLTIISGIGFFYIFFMFKKIFRANVEIDKERNLEIVKSGVGGNNRLLTKTDDVAKVLNVGKYEDNTGIILGFTEFVNKLVLDKDKKENVNNVILARTRIKKEDENLNMVLFGKAGSGKSTRIAINYLFESLKNGESVVCTDTKGDLIKKMYRYCKEYLKIPTYIINLDRNLMMYSDAIDIFSLIGDYSEIKSIKDENERQTAIDLAVSRCDQIGTCILKNLSDKAPNKGDDFWDKEGYNYICFWIRYVFFNERIKKENKNFKYICNELEHLRWFLMKGEELKPDEKSITELINEIKSVPILNETCGYNLSVLTNSTQTVIASAHSGLQITIKDMVNPLISKITSNDEVDLSIVAKEPAIIFINTSADDKSLRFLVATILTLMYQQITTYINKTKELKANQPINIIYDEMTNIGNIPNIDGYLAEQRSKLIRHTLCIQSWALLNKVYDEQTANAIMTNCQYWLLLQTPEEEILKMFEVASGTMTVRGNGERETNNKGSLFNFHLTTQKSTTEVSRAVLSVADLQLLKENELIVKKGGEDIIKLKTWGCWNNPEWNKTKPYHVTYHCPMWRYKEERKRNEDKAEEMKFFDE